jgi:threonyl-tRNA synthetase
VAQEYDDYLFGIAGRLKANGIRVEVDTSDDRFPKKIRTAQKSKVPFMLIAGEDDRSAGAVSFRYRDGSQKNGVPIAEAITEIVEAIESRSQV